MRTIPTRAIGLIMAFGAGVLLSAVAFELVEEGIEQAGRLRDVAFGLFAGSLVYFVGDALIDRRGGDDRKRSSGAQANGSGLAIVLGTVLDGVPESVVIGLTLVKGGAVGVAIVVAVFLSNLPEAISATAGLRTAGWRRSRIFALWAAVVVVSTAASAAGYGIFADASGYDDGAGPGLRGGRDPDHAGRHDGAGGVRERRARWSACSRPSASPPRSPSTPSPDLAAAGPGRPRGCPAAARHRPLRYPRREYGDEAADGNPLFEEMKPVTIRVGINGFGRIGRNFFRAVARAAAPTSSSSASTT